MRSDRLSPRARSLQGAPRSSDSEYRKTTSLQVEQRRAGNRGGLLGPNSRAPRSLALFGCRGFSACQRMDGPQFPLTVPASIGPPHPGQESFPEDSAIASCTTGRVDIDVTSPHRALPRPGDTATERDPFTPTSARIGLRTTGLDGNLVRSPTLCAIDDHVEFERNSRGNVDRDVKGPSTELTIEQPGFPSDHSTGARSCGGNLLLNSPVVRPGSPHRWLKDGAFLRTFQGC